jgi:hypothetical protein
MKNIAPRIVFSRITLTGFLFLLFTGFATAQDNGGEAADRAKALVQGEEAPAAEALAPALGPASSETAPSVRASDAASEEFTAALLSFYDYRFVKCTYSLWSGIRLEQGTWSTSIGFMNRHFSDMFLDCEESADAFLTFQRKRNTGFVLMTGGLLTLALVPSIISWSYESNDPAAAFTVLLPVGGIIIDIIGIVSLSTSLRDLFDAVDLYNAAQIQNKE